MPRTPEDTTSPGRSGSLTMKAVTAAARRCASKTQAAATPKTRLERRSQAVLAVGIDQKLAAVEPFKIKLHRAKRISRARQWGVYPMRRTS